MQKLRWQPVSLLATKGISPQLKDWLSYPGSFIKRLKEHGITQPKISVLNECWKCPELEEARLLDIKPRLYARVREVLIYSDQGPLMVARTVIPRTTLTGKEQQLAYLKTRSLGSILFKDVSVERTEFEYACIKPSTKEYVRIEKAVDDKASEYWARRSLFYIKNKPLLLTEIFLTKIECL